MRHSDPMAAQAGTGLLATYLPGSKEQCFLSPHATAQAGDWLQRHMIDEHDVIGGEQRQRWNRAGFTGQLSFFYF